MSILSLQYDHRKIIGCSRTFLIEKSLDHNVSFHYISCYYLSIKTTIKFFFFYDLIKQPFYGVAKCFVSRSDLILFLQKKKGSYKIHFDILTLIKDQIRNLIPLNTATFSPFTLFFTFTPLTTCSISYQIKMKHVTQYFNFQLLTNCKSHKR